MTISREDLKNLESAAKQRVIDTQAPVFTRKQEREMLDINNKLQEERQDSNVLMAEGLKHFSLDEVKDEYQREYETTARNKDANASDRQVREEAEDKTKAAMKLHKRIQSICGKMTGFKEVVNLNYTIQLINSYSSKTHVKLGKDDSKKLSTLKKKAPGIYERFLKLENVVNMLRDKQGQYPDLYDCAVQDLLRAKSEWERLQEMAETLVVPKPIEQNAEEKNVKKIKPKINKNKEREYVNKFKSLHNRFTVKQENDDNDTVLDTTYQEELAENLKQKKIDWSIIEEKKYQALYKKANVDDPDPQDSMNFMLANQMRKILADPANKGVTPQEVEETVNEYFKRMLEKSEFQARCKITFAHDILDKRYFSNPNIGAYRELQKKQFSENSTQAPHKTISFGSLGANNAEGIFNSQNPGNDPVSPYGNVSFRLNKEKMKGRVSFVCGNSKGATRNPGNYGLKSGYGLDYYDIKHSRAAYIDEKEGHAPDITACGENLEAVYRRAKELKANNWEGLQDGGREAVKTITDHPQYIYYETHYHGNVGVAELDEVTFILNRSKVDLTKASEYVIENEITKDPGCRELYDHINIINKNPKIYGREGMKELKFTIWDTYGHTWDYEKVKEMMEKTKYVPKK